MKNSKTFSFTCQSSKKTTLKYKEISYDLLFKDAVLKISIDENNYIEMSKKNQEFPSEATIVDGFALSHQKKGDIDYKKHFKICWDNETMFVPVLLFLEVPEKIIKEYWQGGSIELGIENEKDYFIEYKDGITAEFIQEKKGKYSFSFSTGLNGFIESAKDGSHIIKYKGDTIDSDIKDFRAISKFIVSRSKYTNNFILYFQEYAEVTISI